MKDITENPLPNVSYLTLEQKIKEESFFSKFIKDVSRYDGIPVREQTMRVVEEVEYRDEVEELFVNNNYEEGIPSLNRA